MNVCVHGALWWTGGIFLPHAEYSQDTPGIKRFLKMNEWIKKAWHLNTLKKTSIVDILFIIIHKVENRTDARVSCYTLTDTRLFFCVVSKREGHFLIVSDLIFHLFQLDIVNSENFVTYFQNLFTLCTSLYFQSVFYFSFVHIYHI